MMDLMQDMLLGSSPGATLKLTALQSRAQFSLWCLLPAPLMLGVNPLQLSAYDALTYSNLEARACVERQLYHIGVSKYGHTFYDV